MEIYLHHYKIILTFPDIRVLLSVSYAFTSLTEFSR